MRHPSVNVLWSIHNGLQSLKINNTSHRLTLHNLQISRHRKMKNFFRRTLDIKIVYRGEIIHAPVWNERLVRKIFITGKRMSKTKRRSTIIEGIQIHYRYIP